MPAQRDERHAVDRFEDHARGSEIRHARRNANGHIGVERKVDELQREPRAALPAMITERTPLSALIAAMLSTVPKNWNAVDDLAP